MSGLPEIPGELLLRYATSAPRYTSYPTAVDWRSDVPGGGYAARLEEAAAAAGPCAVYVHIPFCEERCLFCGCNVVITRDRQRARAYVELLEREVAAIARTGIGRRPVTQYHWGGGTPTYLDEELIRRAHDAILGTFRLEPDAEVAIEVDPRVTTASQLRLLGSLGFTRLSVGIQDFDLDVQHAVKRVQSFEETRGTLEAARAAGFRSVNVDLIYGLPRQTRARFERTLELVLALEPDRIALFHYAHVPWIKKHQTALHLDEAPSAEEKVAIFLRAVERFTAAGYEYLGLDHFARPEDELAQARRDRTLQRNFMGYSTRAGVDLVGLGVSAIGEVGGAYFQNVPELPAWQQRVRETGFATGKTHALDADDRLRRRVIMDLMCHASVRKPEIATAFGVDFDATFATELRDLDPLARDGLVTLGSGEISVTPVGRLFLRNIASCFDRFFRERRKAAAGTEKTFSRTL